MFYEVIPEGRVEALTYDYRDSSAVKSEGDDSAPNATTISLVPGQIVLVPVGKRSVPGVVIKKVAQPEFKTKSILKVLYSKPLPKRLLDIVKFMHDYYLVPSGQAVSLILPRGVQKRRRKTEQMFGKPLLVDEKPPVLSVKNPVDGKDAGPTSMTESSQQQKDTNENTDLEREILNRVRGGVKPELVPSSVGPKTEQAPRMTQIRLNPSQKKALEGLYQAPGATKLLFGVTGSGKTNIYLKMAKNALKQHFSTILLVPEIALTEQLVRVFSEIFSERVVVLHSGLTEAERHLIFEQILHAEEPLVIVGARSALFAPVARLGLIIIDEEHEGTYFQDNAPKYSAIRVASAMARLAGCPLVLGSATPTIEDYYIASKQGSLIQLTKKAKQTAIRPHIQMIDFKNRENFSRNRYFSNALLGVMSRNLEQGRQTLIFHNRRGSAPLTICEDCGEEILCPNCFLPLNLHTDEYTLHCHTCGFKIGVPMACPKCGAPGLVHKGFGTKLLESELNKLFPKAKVKRFDADNKKGEGMDALYSTVRRGEVDILVGTQAIAKGLDLPRLATVGVVQADAGLALPDYLAEERTFQLLTQVIGRVGRGHLDTAEVFIQTFRPEHPVLAFAAKEDYLGFYNYSIARRQKAGFPPFRFVLKLEITMKTEAIVLKKVRELVAKLTKDSRLIVSPPQPGFHERTAKGYTWQLIVRSRSRKALTEACEGLDKNFRITLDPMGLL